MTTIPAPPLTIENYIVAFPPDQRMVLAETLIRIRRAAPGAVEAIRYGMPAFRLTNGRPVYFAGWKLHLSLHDIPLLIDGSGTEGLEDEVAPYRSGKDTLKFPYKKPIPFDLIERAVAAIHGRPSGT